MPIRSIIFYPRYFEQVLHCTHPVKDVIYLLASSKDSNDCDWNLELMRAVKYSKSINQVKINFFQSFK